MTDDELNVLADDARNYAIMQVLITIAMGCMQL